MKKLTRRRFLTHTAVATAIVVGSGFAYRLVDKNNLFAQVLQSSLYPPSLTGLRGDIDSARDAAHSVALAGEKFQLPQEALETYDLVVVGAGVSGLAAAWYYRKQHPQARVLILDNHQDFGGHAVRNEFYVDGKTLITYGGSESIDGPKETYSKNAAQFLRDLGIDYNKFEQYFDQDLYSKKWQLKKGVFFSQAIFGEAKLIAALPEVGGDKATNEMAINHFPLSVNDKKALIALYNQPRDYWKGKSVVQREKLSISLSYDGFLRKSVGLSDGCLKYLHNLSSDYWGHAIDAISVAEALENNYPGVQNLKLSNEAKEHEPYIYHFPDGNASIARLLVRQMIPQIAAGSTMEDIVTAKFDYQQLDRAENNVRIRLKSTVLMMENTANGVAIAYLPQEDKQKKLIRVEAKHAIYAGHSALAARVIPAMPEEQKTAMKTNVKIPMIYAKVVVKNAHFFQKTKVYDIYTPHMSYCFVMLDYPVNMGDYRAPQNPDEPIILHAVRMPTTTDGNTARDKYRAGRGKLLAQNEAQLKQELMDYLREIYSVAGENFDDVYIDATLNRWAHGYSYEQTDLFDSDEIQAKTTKTMRRAVGNIHMANSDVAWMPYLQNAIDEAHRAVTEIG